MERSSPLAAMQPSSLFFGQWACQRDLPNSYHDCGGQFREQLGFGGGNFNFKDLSMTRGSTDYFSLKPVRGSSPTSSLAADLSQNFHIDQRYLSESVFLREKGTKLFSVLNFLRLEGLCFRETSMVQSMEGV